MNRVMSTVIRALSVTVLALTAAFCSAATAVADDPDTWPVAQGNFTSPDDPGWIFFKPQGSEGRGCGISPDGMIGCDIVPSRWPDGTPVQAGMPGPPGFYSCEGRNCPLPPVGADQIVVGPQEPAHYADSATPGFTRDVDVLPSEHRLVNGNAWCRVSQQGIVRCVTGDNGFTVFALGATLE